MTDTLMTHALTSDPAEAIRYSYRCLAEARHRLAELQSEALDTVIAMFAEPRTHGERVTLAQLKAKREAVR